MAQCFFRSIRNADLAALLIGDKLDSAHGSILAQTAAPAPSNESLTVLGNSSFDRGKQLPDGRGSVSAASVCRYLRAATVRESVVACATPCVPRSPFPETLRAGVDSEAFVGQVGNLRPIGNRPVFVE
jgi:hypothetical protein